MMIELDHELDHGEDNAYLTPAELRAFKRHVDGLNKLILSIRERYPEAQYYLACNLGAALNIMSGNPHEGPRATARQDRVIESMELKHADGGDW